ncbi:MAG: helix-turn-helix transcriptional regulator, partial [Rhodospirillales bacterium]|nr:helix-turn-helix transcriptional regulator [Rhodospirillales bacterium]
TVTLALCDVLRVCCTNFRTGHAMSESSELTDALRAALDRPPASMVALAKSAGVSRRWLYNFKDGDIPNPGVDTCSKLAEQLGYRIALVPLS